MTLGEDDNTTMQENMHTKKSRHPMRDVKLIAPRSMGNANRSQSYPTTDVAQHLPNSSAQVELVPGDNIPIKHRSFMPQRSGMHPSGQI